MQSAGHLHISLTQCLFRLLSALFIFCLVWFKLLIVRNKYHIILAYSSATKQDSLSGVIGGSVVGGLALVVLLVLLLYIVWR